MKPLAIALFVLGFLNFASFFAVALFLGGDAINGKIEAGRYYLCSHGRYTEVSQSVFNYSKLHVYSVFITHPLGMLGGLFLYREHQKKKEKPTT